MGKVLAIDDMVVEIALRIPPSDPASLVRAALVSKNWQRLLTSPDFLLAYAERYGRPPFLGYFHSSPSPLSGRQMDRFVPAAAAFPTFSPDIGTDSWYTLDVRQGRVLLLRVTPDLIVWKPMSGEHFLLPRPPRSYQYQAGAVMCANNPQCRDPDCYDVHDFRVIFVGCDDKLVTFNKRKFFEGNETWACIYSQETDEWGEIYVLKDDRYTEHPLLEHNPPVLHRDALYFTLEMHELQGEEVRAALKFDLTVQKLSVVFAPEGAYADFGMFFGTSEGFAFAGIAEEDEDEGTEQNTISIWSLTDSDPAVWSFNRDINLEPKDDGDSGSSKVYVARVPFDYLY
ncbi:uncharacterized protein LOC8064282 [Sorghum bicolor]|uniref:uncharacterized protein LOC8064282 n=1 Tax=Sorghum bicolor TaxID=4558 RepID=UPI000B42549F|nr:uncharacterized protein LOC8064282 [Sorghum bicolor]|eukprot:XP_002452276.2 uncharacterized protein LOC8064282 [Sorghum bicolor]